MCKQVLTDQTLRVLQSIPGQLYELVGSVDVMSDAAKLNGDLRALLLVQQATPQPSNVNASHPAPLSSTLSLLLNKILTAQSTLLLRDDSNTTSGKRHKISIL